MSRDRAALFVALAVLVCGGCSDGGGPSEGAVGPPFTNPTGCPVTGEAASESVRATQAHEGVNGTFVVTEDGSGDIVTDACPDTTVFPSAGGPMAESWANCGFYAEPVSPPHAVHSLHNGAVWIAYRPGLDAEAMRIVRATATRTSHVLASPVEGLGAPIVLTAWQRQLWLDDVHDPRFDEFTTTYIHAPGRPVVYGPCRDGQGRPAASFWDAAEAPGRGP